MNLKDVNYNIIIFILMIVTGCIIYFMFFQVIEKFESTNPNITKADTTSTPAITNADTTSTPAITKPTSTPAITNPTSTPAITNPTSTPAITNPTSTPAITNPTSTPANTGPTTTKSLATTTTLNACAPAPPPVVYNSIMSRYFGVGFNITKLDYNDTEAYLISHIPTISNGTLGGCYALSQDSSLTIKLQNSSDPSQLWQITKNSNSTATDVYYTIFPVTTNKFALHYENGNLAVRPYNPIFEGQKWVLDTSVIKRGIPVLNYSPASLFTPEFDPYGEFTSLKNSSSNITDANGQQINDVINTVKSGIQQYLGQLNNKQQAAQISSSSLGQKDQPLNINFSINSGADQIPSEISQKSSFADVDNTGNTTPTATSTASGSASDNATQSQFFDTIMMKYGSTASPGSNKNVQLYNRNDLLNEINSSDKCKILNLNDYTSNRVSSCNCKL